MNALVRLSKITPRTVLSRRDILLSATAVAAAACVTDAKDPVDSAPDTGVEQEPLATITDNADFYVTSFSSTPSIDATSWTFTLLDRGAVLRVIDYATLTAMEAREKEHTLMCISGGPTNPAIGNAVWTGLPVTEILANLGIPVPDGVIEIKFMAADGYSTSIPVDDLYDEGLHGPLWLVWQMNGADIPPEHGSLCRFLTPGRYGQKNPKWPVSMEFIDEAYLGFWESFGWSNDASYQANGLFRNPPTSTSVPVGPVTVQGVAFAGKDAVVAVNVRVDYGDWQPATLTYAPGADVWVTWAFDYDVAEGEHTLQVQAVTASGVTSNDDPNGTGIQDGYDGGMLISLTGT